MTVENELFEKTLEVNVEGRRTDQEYLYYHGMALKELGREKESEELFRDMLETLQGSSDESGFFTQFEGRQSNQARIATNHYLAGLAYEGLGDKTKAKEEFTEALKINPGHIWSKVHLESL